MTEFATLWDEAGASYDAEQTVRRMASARSAAGFAPFLLAAKSPAEFDQRCVLASDRIQSTAAAHGVTPDALLGQIRGEHTLLMEAQASKTAAKACPNCGGSGSVPAQGHEDADDVDNGHVVCPSCHGSGGEEEFEPVEDSTNYAKYHNFEAAKAPQPARRGFDLYASLHTALEEGQDPLAWIQAQDPGNPTPEKPSEHLDHGDYSNSYSEVPSAAGVVGADKSAQARKTAGEWTQQQHLDHAIETARAHIPIQQKVVRPEHQTGFTIVRGTDGLHHVYKDSAWTKPEGNMLPWSPPSGTPVAKVDLDGNVTHLNEHKQASKRDPRHPFGQPKTAGKEHYDKGYALGDRQVRSDLTSYSLPFGQHVDFVRGHRDAHDGLEPDYDRWQDTSSKTAVVETRVLHMIRDRDPNMHGWENGNSPTAKEFADHKDWAINNFGKDAWNTYEGGKWDGGSHEASKKTAGRRHPFG